MKIVVKIINWAVFLCSSSTFLIFVSAFLVKAFNGVLLDVEMQKVMYLSLIGASFAGSNLYVIHK